MTSIFEITDWPHVVSFFVWTQAVCAIAKGVFGSLPAAELQYRLSPGNVLVQTARLLISQPLTGAEIEARRTELQDLARSLAWRAFTYSRVASPAERSGRRWLFALSRAACPTRLPVC